MLGLCLSTGGFVWAGHRASAPLPAEASLLPLGAAIFTLAIAVDTIGHRTIYKEALRGGEALVHHIIIGAGLASCVLLCAAYAGGATLRRPGAGADDPVVRLQPGRRGDALAPLPRAGSRTWSRCGATSSS